MLPTILHLFLSSYHLTITVASIIDCLTSQSQSFTNDGSEVNSYRKPATPATAPPSPYRKAAGRASEDDSGEDCIDTPPITTQDYGYLHTDGIDEGVSFPSRASQNAVCFTETAVTGAETVSAQKVASSTSARHTIGNERRNYQPNNGALSPAFPAAQGPPGGERTGRPGTDAAAAVLRRPANFGVGAVDLTDLADDAVGGNGDGVERRVGESGEGGGLELPPIEEDEAYRREMVSIPCQEECSSGNSLRAESGIG